MIGYNGQSETAKITSVLMKNPTTAWKNQDSVDAQWRDLQYPSRPNYDRAVEEYAAFASIIERHVPEIFYLPGDDGTGLDSIYTRDPVVITRRGAILCNMGKAARAQEPAAMEKYLAELGVPVLGRIASPGLLEGGDVAWLDERTVAVGLGYRTNAAGVRQFRELLGDLVDEVLEVPLPHWNGAGECMHLMSLISPVDRDLAVVYSRLMPVTFRNYLLERGIELVEVPTEEFDSFGCNVLALAPRTCVMVAGNPRTREALERAGVKVYEYPGDEITLKGGGGPTCLTRPLLRGEE